ncbi:hypothetical protein [Acidovorax sp. SUPP2825]|uniref:hypothetical protein n=1 Tax=Acidovorax sp. SUPP2825 TaxID=2920879 RepID=UPI0023DE3771|nr:hypothetical protein [Acidovorax sp. SUPP2825]GKS97011.1 hypothetical protein AVAK2825_20770 [Acidovorax sp. SUPP2825]
MPSYLTTIIRPDGTEERHLDDFGDPVIAAQEMARRRPAAQSISVETYGAWKARRLASIATRKTAPIQHDTHALPPGALVFAPGVVEAYATHRSVGCYALVLAAVLAFTLGLAMLLGCISVRGLPL